MAVDKDNREIDMKYLILLSLFFLGCKTQKSHVYKTDVKRDSIKYVTDRTVFAPVLSQITIKDICDSITNKPRIIRNVFVRGKDTVFVETGLEGLKMRFNFYRDSIEQSKKFEKSDHDKSSDELKVVTKTPKWAWWAMGVLLGLHVVFFVFPIVPRFLRGLVV